MSHLLHRPAFATRALVPLVLVMMMGACSSTTDSGGSVGSGGAAGSEVTGGTRAGGDVAAGAAGASGGAAGAIDNGQAMVPVEAGAGSDGGSGGASASGDGGGMAPDPALESIEVSGSTGSAISHTSLDAGELFLLRASGSVDFGGTLIDAEFGGFAAGKQGSDTVGTVDVGIDFGLKTVRAAVTPVTGRMKWFGSYRDDHVYHVIVNGEGKPLSLKMWKPTETAGSGNIVISLYRLSPTSQSVGKMVDTVAAALTNASVKSATTTNEGTVYLLQCDGQGPVGGNGLANGDADWMDYAADGSGKVDIGDANTDYGLGVDEPFVGKANTNTPRKRWWGPWRRDHIYYMLFAGTGNPLDFHYYDVGYGDNSTTVKLTVRVRELH